MPLRRGPAIRVSLGDPADQAADAYVVVEHRRRLSVDRGGDPRRITVKAVHWSLQHDREYLLADAYRGVLGIADRRQAGVLAVPGSLARGWPIEDLTRIALKVLHSTPTQVREVVIATATVAFLEAWAEALVRS